MGTLFVIYFVLILGPRGDVSILNAPVHFGLENILHISVSLVLDILAILYYPILVKKVIERLEIEIDVKLE
jgi:hypothetical protein